MLDSGEVVASDSVGQLRPFILNGGFGRQTKARRVVRGADGKTIEGEWTTLEKLASTHTGLRDLYRPVWHYTMKFAGYGAITGIALKTLDTSVTIFSLNETAGIIWLAVVASILLSSKWPYAFAAGLFLSLKFGVRANLFVTAITTALVGAAFGVPIGMILGTLVGHAKARSRPKAPDAPGEGNRPYLLGIVIPILILAVLIPLYIWFNLQVLARMGSK